jgi:[ribosomal protein S5]-alanine N-acetyltransferase
MLITSFEPFPTLATKRLLLRCISRDDVSEMFVLRSDRRILTHRLPIQTNDEALAYIQKITDELANGVSITWAIQFKDDPKLLGTVCFWNFRKEHDRAEIGYALLTDHHRNGIMTEVLPAVLNYGFETMKLHSVEGHIDPANRGSQKVLERNGFVREAYFKDNIKYPDGSYRDTAVYSLLAPR